MRSARTGRHGVRRRGAALVGVALMAVAPVALVAVAAPAAAQAAAQAGATTVGPGAPGDLPVSKKPAPDPAAVKKTSCLVGSSSTTAGITAQPWAQRQLGYEKAWTFGRGEGQKIAVIDTGVNLVPRLTVQAGGDYVAPQAGTTDCDGHGTIVASIIGAKRDLAADPTGYAGVAPAATILSIRQYSALYETTYSNRTKGPPGDLSTLASSIVWAADQGSTVINISEAACGVAANGLSHDAEVGAALRYAVDAKNVVVVVAAGNVETRTGCLANAADGVSPPVTAVSPAWWDDYVLAVGSVGENGQPSEFTLAGPWVDVAAPGEGIVSVNPVAGPALINQLGAEGGTKDQIRGTSFAAPYVAGTVALVRERFPSLDARQVMARIEATAQAPAGGTNELVGHGTVDPVAAVTDVLPDDVQPRVLDGSSSEFLVPPAPRPPSTTPRTVAFVGSAVALGSVLATSAVLHAVARSRRRSA